MVRWSRRGPSLREPVEPHDNGVTFASFRTTGAASRLTAYEKPANDGPEYSRLPSSTPQASNPVQENGTTAPRFPVPPPRHSSRTSNPVLRRIPLTGTYALSGRPTSKNRGRPHLDQARATVTDAKKCSVSQSPAAALRTMIDAAKAARTSGN
jgi:hypothetical protein